MVNPNCIIPSTVEKLRDAIKEGKIKPSSFFSMDNDEMIKRLEPIVGKDAQGTATFIQSKFILKERVRGLGNAFKKLTETGRYSPEEIARQKQIMSDYKAAQQERVFNPKEHESYLAGLAEKRFGTMVPRDVAVESQKLFQDVLNAKGKNTRDSGLSDDYIKAVQKFQSYVHSQKPEGVWASSGKNLNAIRRNSMLISLSTPEKTFLGQQLSSGIDALARIPQEIFTKIKRTREFNEVVKHAKDDAWKQWQNTKVDTTLLNSLDTMPAFYPGEADLGVEPDANVGSKIGVATAKGLGAVAKATQKVAIDWEHVPMFTHFHESTFFSVADVLSRQLAKSPREAIELFKDAVKMEPETDLGKKIRLGAQVQAARVTSTNIGYSEKGTFDEGSWGSAISLGIKDAINNVFPGAGTNLVPIAKIPGNVAANSIENAGVGAILGVKDLWQGTSKIKSENKGIQDDGKIQLQRGLLTLTRALGVPAVCYVIVNSIPREDMKYEDHSYYIKFGDNWVPLEFAGPLAASLGGMIQAKMDTTDNGGEPLSMAAFGSYVKGAGQGAESTIFSAPDSIKYLYDNLKSGKIAQVIAGQLPQLPPIVTNLFRDRPIKRELVGGAVKSDADFQADEYRKETGKRFTLNDKSTWGSQ